MSEHRFLISDPAAFLEISELMYRNCRIGERVEILLPSRGFARVFAGWRTEQARLLKKMDSPPTIHVSVNQSGVEEIVVRLEKEVAMNRAIINNILERLSPFERIRQWISDDAADEAKSAGDAGTAAPLNILYSTLQDCLVAHNHDIESLDAGNEITNSIRGVSIWPQTEHAKQFISKHISYGSALERGVRRFIQGGSGSWSLLKAAPDMSIELHYEKHPEKDTQVDFYIEFNWGNTAAEGTPFRGGEATQGKSSFAAGSRIRLFHPLTITVDYGFGPMVHQITHVPCRITCLEGELPEISLRNCKLVSKKHAVLELQDGQLVLKDEKSANGTFTATGMDLRQMPGMRYPIQVNSSSEFFLCLGRTDQQIRNNRISGDRAMFPRLVIEYGNVTPELCEIDGTPELDDFANL